VVILITGLTSELPQTSPYNPLSQIYCGLANPSASSGDLAALAHMAQKTLDDKEDGTISPINLTDSLAATGAVLLPFSYDGVSLTQARGKPPLYQVGKFDSGTPGAVNPKDEATGYLLGLIKQIHSVWPDAHIQVIGHSEGGFVAEQLFEWEKYSTLTSQNVTRIFSLDSPINGVALASNDWLNKICATASGPSNASCLGIISPPLLQLYAERWQNKEANDRALIKRDAGEEHQIYIPIGTQNDWLYKIADISTTFGDLVTGVCEGLDTQILWNDFSFSCYLEDIQNQGGRWPSFVSDVTPDPSSGTPTRPGFALKSHDFVMQSADNIKFITALGPGAYAQTARASRRFAAQAAAYSSTALTASNTSPPGALFEQILAPAPFAVLPNPVARSGQAFKITGSDLGDTPGHVFFSSANGEVAAIIRSWTPEGVEVVVPAEATSGIVRVLTPTEDELLPGVVAVVASGQANKVVRILDVGRSRAINGEGDRIKLRALDTGHRAVSGAMVELVGGGLTRRARTNHRGLATFIVVGDDEQQYIAVSGTTTTLFTAHWRRAARQTLVLTVHRKRRHAGRPAIWTIVTSIRNAAGRPVAGELVNYELHALPGSKLNRTSARTNQKGIAHVTLSVPFGAAALVEALTDHARLARGVTVND
jgi:PGAP1-like protein